MASRREVIAAKVDEHLGELLSLSQWLHDHPETAWQEYESAQRVSAALGGHGLELEILLPAYAVSICICCWIYGTDFYYFPRLRAWLILQIPAGE